MCLPRLRNRTLRGQARHIRQSQSWSVDMLDLVYLALGAGVLIALGIYARAIGKL